MTDIKKDPAQDWELSDEYYHENPQSGELRLEDFMNSSPAEFAGDDGSIVCDGHDANVHEVNAYDANAHGTNTHDANADELSRVAQLVSLATALSCQGKTAAAIAGELNITEQYVNDILVCVQAFPGDNPVAVAHMLMG